MEQKQAANYNSLLLDNLNKLIPIDIIEPAAQRGS